jgi:SnoaL-like domain
MEGRVPEPEHRQRHFEDLSLERQQGSGLAAGHPLARIGRYLLIVKEAAVESSRIALARELYEAFAAGDRAAVERRLGRDFTFSAPPDPLLDRDGYFERCWPGAGKQQEFDFVRLVESGDEVIVTYEVRRPDGTGGRNTEVLTFDRSDRITRIEVYFGWDL